MSLNIPTKTSGDAITSADFNAIVSAVNANETAIDGKQDVLESGTNIKTINGDSILGSGDIEMDAPIQSISVNGDDVPPDENGNVEIEAYQKPQTGIPESDLSEGVQTKLNDDLAKRLAMYGKDVTPTDSSKFTWTLIQNNTQYQIGAGETLTGDIIIPYEYEGKPVTRLGAGLFKGQTGVTSIAIPRSITSMNNGSNNGVFQGCTGLTSIEIPDTVSQLDARYTFYGCTNLISVKLGKKIKYLGDYYFYGCSSLETIEIPDGALGVGINVGGTTNELTFANCPNLKKVIIPDSVTAFGTTLFGSTSGGNLSANAKFYCYKGSTPQILLQATNYPYKAISEESVYVKSGETALSLVDGGVYYLTNVGTLAFTYPNDTYWDALVTLTTKATGTVAVSFPQGTSYIGDTPNFTNSETWEISIRDGVVVAGKAVSES